MGAYHILLKEQVEVEELNGMSPHYMTAVSGADGNDCAGTEFVVLTDQSGMIGLLRHLHGLGFVILSVAWQPESSFSHFERKEQ